MNKRAVAAGKDGQLKESFIRDNEQLILRLAYKACGRYITKSDDEWSVSLIAFNKAIDTYSEDKGDFAAYASVVIKRALIDHRRSESRRDSEIATGPEMLTGEGEYEENSEILRAITRESREEEDRLNAQRSLKDEITEINGRLKKYGFSFYDLAECSPKAGKTRKECAAVISYILDNGDVCDRVISEGKLPVKEIAKEADVSKKLIDRYRRYLIMAVVVLNGEYPLLADYLEYVRKDAHGT